MSADIAVLLSVPKARCYVGHFPVTGKLFGPSAAAAGDKASSADNAICSRGRPYFSGLPIWTLNNAVRTMYPYRHPLDRHGGYDMRDRPRNAPQVRGPSPQTRRRLLQELGQDQQIYAQMRQFADADALEALRAEMRIKQEALMPKAQNAGVRLEGGAAVNAATNPAPPRLIGPVLSQEDPRLPPRGIANDDHVALYDDFGPRHLLLVTLDNPSPNAVARAQHRKDLARLARIRTGSEVDVAKMIQAGVDGKAFDFVSAGPRGDVWWVRRGKEEVVDAVLGLEVWEGRMWVLLGVGRGGDEGDSFVLHTPKVRSVGVAAAGNEGGKAKGRKMGRVDVEGGGGALVDGMQLKKKKGKAKRR
ncbi:hypothetical protein K490DRAFT_56695 [Saccharata proteae CBS 121410]|uniref:Uncharacterized protein n=1 Tax=Saccharata proteae CBS 121410 TaxID=1314787 RepID=A0A9P4HTA1_9PEZI|nr:hypothetical protein K490DRAFT_56695 [Saccharata proteae CBS 121410]